MVYSHCAHTDRLHMCHLFFFKQKTAYEMRISDWSSDVCSSDLNYHVIKDADEIVVRMHDERQFDAELVGRDTKTDLALLKVKTDQPLPFLEMGDSDAMRVGDWVIAIGNPFGLGGTVTAGIISARQRDINAGPYDDFIQTDASINRGNSGGPMVGLDGKVVGLAPAIFSPSGGSVGVGFAVPSSLAGPAIAQLREFRERKSQRLTSSPK